MIWINAILSGLLLSLIYEYYNKIEIVKMILEDISYLQRKMEKMYEEEKEK